jgi:flagellar hook-length control protein FliK
MNNLPITTSVQPVAAKPAQAAQTSLAASPTQASKSAPAVKPAQGAKPVQAAKPAEDASPPRKAFGDVLARHVSDAASVEDTPLSKKTSAKFADEIVSDITAKTEDVTAAILPVNTNLPSDMLATLIPQNVTAPQAEATVPDIPVIQNASMVQDASMLQGASMVQATSMVPAASTAESEAAPAHGSPAVPVATMALKDELGVDKKISVASKLVQAAATPAAADSKKEATFSNMMQTLSATKLSATDDKAAALAAAPEPNAAAILSATSPVTPTSVMPTQVTINTPVSHEKWGDEFNQKITWLSNQKEQTAELHLNPPQLGPMDVVLKVSGDQATALFTSPHAAVREAVEQALPKLREMLAESGIMLGNATVSDQAPRNRQDENERKSSSSRSSIGGVADSSAAGNQNARVSLISRHNGIVDTFA